MTRSSAMRYECVWWVFFFIIAIWTQRLLPGIDALCIGLILVLQEGRLGRLLWLFPLLILVQEGGGSLAFGSSIIWYGSMVLFFVIGRNLFAVDSLIFMILFSLALGLMRFALIEVMSSLQGAYVPMGTLVNGSILQVLATPIAWGLALAFRQRFISNAHSV